VCLEFHGFETSASAGASSSHFFFVAEIDQSGASGVLVAETASFSARFHDWLENAEKRVLRSHRAESVLILRELLAIDHEIFAS
jgi:hypothetical protein